MTTATISSLTLSTISIITTKYAVLVDTNDECDCEDEECDCETNVYIMQVVVNEAEDTEEFVSPPKRIWTH